MGTLLDRSNILCEPAATLKGTIYAKWLYDGIIIPNAYNNQALDLL
jgi:hypothetical protein